VPELQEAFEKYDLFIKTSAVIYRPPFYCGGVHIDGGIGIRMLMPIKNCRGSYTKFFNVDRSKIEIR
jgi:hypothetical protein